MSLRERRTEAGLTQEELANRAGVTLRTVQRAENGVGTPSERTMELLAAALGIAREDLVAA